MSINYVALSGNLTRNAELRYTNSGLSVLKFTVAVNDRVQNKQTGEWEDYPNFVDCTLFGRYGAAVAPSMLKGAKVALDGRLHFSKWEKDGDKRSKLDVIVNNLEIMPRLRDEVERGAVSASVSASDGMDTQTAAAMGAVASQYPGVSFEAVPAASGIAQADLYGEEIPF